MGVAGQWNIFRWHSSQIRSIRSSSGGFILWKKFLHDHRTCLCWKNVEFRTQSASNYCELYPTGSRPIPIKSGSDSEFTISIHILISMPEYIQNLQQKVWKLPPWLHPPEPISEQWVCLPIFMPKNPYNVIFSSQVIKICEKDSKKWIKNFHPKNFLRGTP